MSKTADPYCEEGLPQSSYFHRNSLRDAVGKHPSDAHSVHLVSYRRDPSISWLLLRIRLILFLVPCSSVPVIIRSFTYITLVKSTKIIAHSFVKVVIVKSGEENLMGFIASLVRYRTLGMGNLLEILLD